MNTSSLSTRTPRDVLTVDLHGMKAALRRQAGDRGVPLSSWVRDVLASTLTGSMERSDAVNPCEPSDHDAKRVRVSLRLATSDAQELLQASRRAGRPLGRYVIDLMRTKGELPTAEEWRASVAALTRSNSELATLSRHIAHLTSLLRQSEVLAAQQYRRTLLTLDRDVRAHLTLASKALGLGSPR